MLFFMCVSQVMALKTESNENDREKKAESEESRQRRIEELQVRMCVYIIECSWLVIWSNFLPRKKILVSSILVIY